MRYWVGVASRQHVLRGAEGGFCQVCHGKKGPLQQMKEGDWIVYYSPTEVFGEKAACRRFTAIGRITARLPYLFPMSSDFTPWRRDVIFSAAQEADIVPLISQLSFIHDPSRWGFPFRRGCFSIPRADFELIANAMGVSL
jgi:EVE domain